jgi:biotin-(acetyl-CoA carboxylase) ligase
MQHFKETDFEDAEFPYSSKRIHELKHNAKEVEKVCKKVEEYARNYAKNNVEEYAQEYARDCKIITAIEMGLQFNITQEQIISSICNKYGLSKEEAMEYYEEVALQPV